MFNPELQFNAIQTAGNHNHVPARPYFPRGLRLNVCVSKCVLPQLGRCYEAWVEEKD